MEVVFCLRRTDNDAEGRGGKLTKVFLRLVAASRDPGGKELR